MTKTIFITGASTGIGKATAIYFASKGWDVIATMRNPEVANELSLIKNISLLKLDVNNVEEINETVAKAIALQNIDVVFNNAGYGLAGPLEGTSDEQLTNIISTNLLGVIRVTKAFIPYFREEGKGLFISTTSIGGLVTFPFFSVYHATKWAIEGWSESMAFELKRFGIGIKTVSPGSTKTDFASRSIDTASHPEYDEIVKNYFEAFLSPDVMENLSAPEQIAEVVFEAATDNKEILRYVAGKDAIVLYEKRQEVGDEVFRKQIDEMYFKK